MNTVLPPRGTAVAGVIVISLSTVPGSAAEKVQFNISAVVDQHGHL